MNSNKHTYAKTKSNAPRRSATGKRRHTICVERSKFQSPTAYILDSGGCTIKTGNTFLQEPVLMPNSIVKTKSVRNRVFISDQIEDCLDRSGLYYSLPCERGYVTKWDAQKPIWDYVFEKYPIGDEPLIMTQPIYNFRAIQECVDEIFFEEYGIYSMIRINPTDLARRQYVHQKGVDTSCIIVDSGYSFTHIVPYINGKKYFPGMRRIDVGGKFLTNYLKQIITHRQLNVMAETYVINQVKEDTCCMSKCIKEDMKIAKFTDSKNTILRNYVLPDFHNIWKGYIHNPEDVNSTIPAGCQTLRLNNERFTVPELLIRPSCIGMQSMGIPELLSKCIQMCPESEWGNLMKNIVLIGGNTNFPNYKERIYRDLRSYTPCHLPIEIYQAENPITYAWHGGRLLAEDPKFHTMLVTKYDYEEEGSRLTYKKFNDWTTAENKIPVKAEVKPRRMSMLDNLRGLDIFGKGGEKPEEPSPEPSTSTAEKIEPVKEEVKRRRSSMLDNVRRLDILGKGGEKPEEPSPEPSTSTAEKIEPVKEEVKRRRSSMLDNVRRLDILGKGGEKPEEPSPEPSISTAEKKKPVKEEVKRRRSSMLGNVSRLDILGKGGEKPEEPSPEPSTATAEKKKPVKAEAKRRRSSMLDNVRRLDILGKGGEKPEEPSPESSTSTAEKKKPVKAEVKLDNVRRLDMLGKGGEKPEASTSTAENMKAIEGEVKPRRISTSDNSKGLYIFGKGPETIGIISPETKSSEIRKYRPRVNIIKIEAVPPALSMALRGIIDEKWFAPQTPLRYVNGLETTAENTIPVKAGVKPRRISMWDSVRDLDILGKGGEKPEEPSPEPSPEPSTSTAEKIKPVKEKVKRRRSSMFDNVRRLNILGKGGEKPEEPRPEPSTLTAEKIKPVKEKVKRRRSSMLDNVRRLDILGKGGEKPEEPSPEPSTSTAEKMKAIEGEVKPRRISTSDNSKGSYIFGKGPETIGIISPETKSSEIRPRVNIIKIEAVPPALSMAQRGIIDEKWVAPQTPPPYVNGLEYV